MAGSLAHITNSAGGFTVSLLDDVSRDALEALEECFDVIGVLCGGDLDLVNDALERLRYPKLVAAPQSAAAMNVLDGMRRNENLEWVQASTPWRVTPQEAPEPEPAREIPWCVRVHLDTGASLAAVFDSEAEAREATNELEVDAYSPNARAHLGDISVRYSRIVGWEVKPIGEAPGGTPPLANIGPAKPASKTERRNA